MRTCLVRCNTLTAKHVSLSVLIESVPPKMKLGHALTFWFPEDMQQDAIDCAAQAMEKYNIEKDIAAYIKKEFDKKYNPTWHCIVGRNFGSYVTHETKHFIYFYLGQVAILLFKSG
mmetsp:Transcript_25801/g.51745  ORF Transcript_25801/g.51745 Transcript_25801/m.51745 type:complete len:116 (+) Transcript_25801:109-456(+)